MATGRKRADLDSDRQFSLALVRLLEIIGEAANRVPDDQRARIPDVPWAQIVGLRNRMSAAARATLLSRGLHPARRPALPET